jgi:creatinine amidohydrolase/Fe(II)-dependent formamide hydrolase-like protein
VTALAVAASTVAVAASTVAVAVAASISTMAASTVTLAVAVTSISASTVAAATVAVAAVAVALSPAVSEWHRQWLWHPRVPGSVPQPFPQLDNLIRVLGKNSASQGISVIVLVNFIANLGFCW